MKQAKWFDRVFEFNSTQNIFPAIMERLADAPLRLEYKLKNIDPAILTFRDNTSWTIKENVGHLTDLEPLWQGRLLDIINGETELRPTDLQNTQTTLANHNAVDITDLLQNFWQIRQTTMAMLRKLDEATVFKSALHPRLKTPMRTMDLFLFVADHDDHHLATITQLINMKH